MKIAFTADTHLVQEATSLTTDEQIDQMAEEIHAHKPDLLIHGGDIGETNLDIDNFRQVLTLLGQGALVIGNHDLWRGNRTEPFETSWDLWETILPTICKEEGWHYLEHKNLIRQGVAVVGSYLHYDYSAQDPEGAAVNHIRASFPEWTPDEYYERMKKRVVNDAKFFTQDIPRDKDFAADIGQGFRKRLLSAERHKKVHSIVIVTHVPCMPCQITRRPHDWHWSCATAYFGNLSHVETIMGCSKVKLILSGHSHEGNENTIKFDDGHEVTVITLDSTYGKPTFKIVELNNVPSK